MTKHGWRDRILIVALIAVAIVLGTAAILAMVAVQMNAYHWHALHGAMGSRTQIRWDLSERQTSDILGTPHSVLDGPSCPTWAWNDYFDVELKLPSEIVLRADTQDVIVDVDDGRIQRIQLGAGTLYSRAAVRKKAIEQIGLLKLHERDKSHDAAITQLDSFLSGEPFGSEIFIRRVGGIEVVLTVGSLGDGEFVIQYSVDFGLHEPFSPP